jgi:hypothetical protein
LLVRKRKHKAGEPPFAVNYHETGPSYASAYGLVAAYHHEYLERADGTIRVGGDEGIRTHGSVDYMSIMRRHSHGCHRLHNHIAVRLMSFVLGHSPHKRSGQQPLAFKKMLVHEDKTYELDIKQGGYLFTLERPIKIEVLEGRVRGDVKKPIEAPIPKWNADYGAYVTPDGGAVEVRGRDLIDIPLPPLLDGGIPLEPSAALFPTTTAAPTGAVAPHPAQPRGLVPTATGAGASVGAPRTTTVLPSGRGMVPAPPAPRAPSPPKPAQRRADAQPRAHPGRYPAHDQVAPARRCRDRPLSCRARLAGLP